MVQLLKDLHWEGGSSTGLLQGFLPPPPKARLAAGSLRARAEASTGPPPPVLAAPFPPSSAHLGLRHDVALCEGLMEAQAPGAASRLQHPHWTVIQAAWP